MKYFSEVLNKTFDSEKECLEAENLAKLAKEKADKEAKEKKEKRAARAAEVEQAIKDSAAAQKKAEELLKAFVKDYGSYHTTLKDVSLPSFSTLLDYLFF